MTRHYINVIIYRAFAEMKAEVSNGFLGMSIWVLEPVIYLGAFYLIFKVIGSGGDSDPILFLLPGLVVWKWFAASVVRGSASITRGAYIMQQIDIPKYVFIGTELLSCFYHFLIIFFLMLVFLMLYGVFPTPSWCLLLPVILIQTTLIVGVSGFFASLIPIQPDLQIVVNNGLMLVFFLSGIFFDINQASDLVQKILYLNPMAILVDSYRNIFLFEKVLNWWMLGYVFLLSIILIIISSVLLKRWERYYPKVLSI